MNVGDLVRSPSGDIGIVIQSEEWVSARWVYLEERIRVAFNYGEYDMPIDSLEVVSAGR